MKTLLNSASAVVCRLRTDEDGATALSFALGLTVMLSAIGVGMDFTVASKAHNKAQNIADSVALNAAVFVRENDDEMPGSDAKDAFVHNATYTASEVGYKFDGLISDEVQLKVEYDMTNREATATVWGSTQTTFTSFLGHEKMPFESKATVKFLTNRITAPASVFVIADNSGSMSFDDKPSKDAWQNWHDSSVYEGAKPRIVGLQESVKDFMDTLYDIAGDQDEDDQRVLRTGLVPYSTNIINNLVVDRQWGYVSTGDIDAMKPTGGTNSAPPMKRVSDWMLGNSSQSLESERTIHKNEHTMEPLLYAVFLSDGQNSGDADMWVPFEGGGTWTGEYCETRKNGEVQRESWTDVDKYTRHQQMDDAKKCRVEWIEWERTASKIRADFNDGNWTYKINWGTNNNTSWRGWETVSESYYYDQRLFSTNWDPDYRETPVTAWCDIEQEGEVCETYDAQDVYGRVDFDDVIVSETQPYPGMVEGKFVNSKDWDTLAECQAMKASGVKIFTIGFALEPGRYWTDRARFNKPYYEEYMEWASIPGDEIVQRSVRAETLLQDCASKPINEEDEQKYFLLADDASELDVAFEKIGKTISEEVVRLSR